METHKIFSGLAGWLLLIGLCIYAWALSFKSSPPVLTSSLISPVTNVVPLAWQQHQLAAGIRKGNYPNSVPKMAIVTTLKVNKNQFPVK